jgi:hypothetical protein
MEINNMSRTFRRKRDKKYNSRFEKDYTHYYDTGVFDRVYNTFNEHGLPRIKLEGKEWQIAYWKYHSDNGFAIFGFQDAYETPMIESEQSFRSRWRFEIHKFMKYEDYEVNILKRRLIWDYC